MTDEGALVLCRLGKHYLAFPVHSVREVLDDVPVTPVPLAPPHLSGLVNLRGEVLTVVDTCGLLGVDSVEAEGGQVHLVLSMRSEARSLLVDEVLEVIRPTEDLLLDLPPGIEPRLERVSEGLVNHPDCLVLRCSVMAVFSEILQSAYASNAASERKT